MVIEPLLMGFKATYALKNGFVKITNDAICVKKEVFTAETSSKKGKGPFRVVKGPSFNHPALLLSLLPKFLACRFASSSMVTLSKIPITLFCTVLHTLCTLQYPPLSHAPLSIRQRLGMIGLQRLRPPGGGLWKKQDVPEQTRPRCHEMNLSYPAWQSSEKFWQEMSGAHQCQSNLAYERYLARGLLGQINDAPDCIFSLAGQLHHQNNL